MATRQVYGVANFFDIRLIMSEVAASTERELAKAMGKWANSMNRSLSQSREKELKKVHQQTAKIAREAVISAYNSSGIGNDPSYRQNDRGKLRRYSNGAMERALKSKGLIEGDGRGIRFIDKDIMDRTAKQWYRLNFGALPGGSKNPSVGSMRFFGRASSQRAELTGFRPSKPFRVPAGGVQGFWSSTYAPSSNQPLKAAVRGQRGALYIRRKGMQTTGKIPVTFFRGQPSRNGIQGKRFLDAGARAINETYPKLVTEMIISWTDKARRSMR